MARTRQLIAENLSLVGLVIEVADARAPRATRYPGLSRLVRGRPILTVLGKADLADPVKTAEWVRYLDEGAGRLEEGRAISFAALPGEGKVLRDILALASRIGRRSSGRPVGRAMVVGLPNVGKSTLINRLAGHASAATGNRPGITRGKQWLRAGEGLELLDLPGILVPGHIPSRVFLVLALLGLLPQHAYDAGKVAEYGLEVLAAAGRPAPFGVSSDASGEAGNGGVREALVAFAKARGHLRKGGQPDIERAAVAFIGAFREGRLGRITLESPTSPTGGSNR